MQNEYDNEEHFQAAAFQWTWNNFPHLRKLFFKVHNEGRKSMRQAMQDKAKGVVAGIPDIVFIQPPMGIELKVKRNTLSQAQKQVREIWTSAGVGYYVARTMEEYQTIIYDKVVKNERGKGAY